MGKWDAWSEFAYAKTQINARFRATSCDANSTGIAVAHAWRKQTFYTSLETS